jgi:hypothetical protein
LGAQVSVCALPLAAIRQFPPPFDGNYIITRKIPWINTKISSKIEKFEKSGKIKKQGWKNQGVLD